MIACVRAYVCVRACMCLNTSVCIFLHVYVCMHIHGTAVCPCAYSVCGRGADVVFKFEFCAVFIAACVLLSSMYF